MARVEHSRTNSGLLCVRWFPLRTQCKPKLVHNCSTCAVFSHDRTRAGLLAALGCSSVKAAAGTVLRDSASYGCGQDQQRACVQSMHCVYIEREQCVWPYTLGDGVWARGFDLLSPAVAGWSVRVSLSEGRHLAVAEAATFLRHARRRQV